MAWRKSSRCDSGACIEVDFRQSSKCDTGACVQIGFRKSSKCDSGSCVEVGQHEGAVLVRDSKQVNLVGEGGSYDVLRFSAGDWRQLLADVPVRNRG